MVYILYNAEGSPPCAQVRILARLIGVELEIREIDTFKQENFTPDFLKMNPFHRIPTFSDDAFIIYESSAICYYLLRKHAQNSDLYPNCIKSRAQIDQALATVTSTIQPHCFAFLRPRYKEHKKPTPQELDAFNENVIKGFENIIGEGPFVKGDKMTLADISIVCHLTLILEAPYLKGEEYPKLKSYYERVKAQLPCFKEITHAGISRFINNTCNLH